MSWPPRAASIALAAALTAGGALAIVGGSPAQEGRVYGADQFFTVVWEPVEHGGRFSIGGYIANRYGVEATHVRLMVEALDQSGKVISRTLGHVNYPIPPGGRGFFEVFVPEKAPGYRAFVFSWDWRRSPSGS